MRVARENDAVLAAAVTAILTRTRQLHPAPDCARQKHHQREQTTLLWHSRERIMCRGKALLISVFLIALIVLGNLLPSRGQTRDGPPRVRQKWQYAQLLLAENSSSGEWYVHWVAGTKSVESKGKKSRFEAVSEIYKGLGGTEKAALAVLLDHIGQDGWELVSHAVRGDSLWQLYTFKRPAQ